MIRSRSARAATSPSGAAALRTLTSTTLLACSADRGSPRTSRPLSPDEAASALATETMSVGFGIASTAGTSWFSGAQRRISPRRSSAGIAKHRARYEVLQEPHVLRLRYTRRGEATRPVGSRVDRVAHLIAHPLVDDESTLLAVDGDEAATEEVHTQIEPDARIEPHGLRDLFGGICARNHEPEGELLHR
jgi:hypothetical protein